MMLQPKTSPHSWTRQQHATCDYPGMSGRERRAMLVGGSPRVRRCCLSTQTCLYRQMPQAEFWNVSRKILVLWVCSVPTMIHLLSPPFTRNSATSSIITFTKTRTKTLIHFGLVLARFAEVL